MARGCDKLQDLVDPPAAGFSSKSLLAEYMVGYHVQYGMDCTIIHRSALSTRIPEAM